MGFVGNLQQTESRRVVVSMNSSDSSKERSGRLPMEKHPAYPPRRPGVWAVRDYPPGCGRCAPPIVRPNQEEVCASTEKLVPRKYPPRKSVFAVRDFPPYFGRNALGISKEMNDVRGSAGSKNICQEMSDAEPLKEMVMTVGKEITDGDLDRDAYRSTLQRDVPRSKGGEVQQEPKGSSTKGVINQDEIGDGSKNAVKVVQEGRPQRSVEFVVGNAQDQKFDAVPKSAIGAPEKDPGKKIAAFIENGSRKRKIPDVSGWENESLKVDIVPGRLVIGLMAKKNCPWRQVKANNKLDNLAGSMSEKKWKRDDFVLVPRSDSQPEKSEEENHRVSHIKKNSFQTQEAYLGADYIVESDTEDHCPLWQVKANNKLDNVAGSMSENQWKIDDFTLAPRSDYEGVDIIVESDMEDHLDQDDERDDFQLVKIQHSVAVNLPPSIPSSSGGKVVENDATVSRKKVRETMQLFQSVYRKILQKEEAKVKEAGGCKRIDYAAAKAVKEQGKYINVGKQIIGSVPGVEVGDEFQYRVELTIIGLHRQTQGGIDYVKQG